MRSWRHCWVFRGPCPWWGRIQSRRCKIENIDNAECSSTRSVLLRELRGEPSLVRLGSTVWSDIVGLGQRGEVWSSVWFILESRASISPIRTSEALRMVLPIQGSIQALLVCNVTMFLSQDRRSETPSETESCPLKRSELLVILKDLGLQVGLGLMTESNAKSEGWVRGEQSCFPRDAGVLGLSRGRTTKHRAYLYTGLKNLCSRGSL